jgi:hypothetical protein
MTAIAANPPENPVVAMLDELLERGMKLARAVSDQALQDGAAEPKPRSADPRQIFLRLWTAMRQTIALQARLTARPKAAAPASKSAAAEARRDIIRRALDIATATHPNRVKVRLMAQQRMNQMLARDPEGTTPLPDQIAAICQACGIKFDREKHLPT